MKIWKNFYFLLALLVLFLTPSQAAPLKNGKDVLLLKIEKVWEFQGKKAPYALSFERVDEKDPLFGSSVKAILNSKGLQNFIRDYHWLAGEMKKEARPIPYVFSTEKQGPSFCVTQPYLVGGKGKKALHFGPVIYLSKHTCQALEQGRLPERTLCHETGHAIMGAFVGIEDLKKGISPEYVISLITGEGHWRSKKTDPIFAFMEGWAEYCGNYYQTSRKANYRYLKNNLSRIGITEGAIADLLLKITREGKIKDFHRKLLQVVVKDHPAHVYELFQKYCRRFPKDRDQLKKEVSRITEQKWTFEVNYKLSSLLTDGRKNWERLSRILKAKAGMIKDGLFELEKWRAMAKEIWKAYPYLRRELERVWPQIKRELPKEIWNWLKRRLRRW